MSPRPVTKQGRGRPSLGDRDQFMVRPPRVVGDEIRRRADAAGLYYGEYVAAVLCQHVGREDLADDISPKEELPIKTA